MLMNKRRLLESKIGQRVDINGYGDLGMDAEMRPFIWNNESVILVVGITKAGLVNIEVDGDRQYSVPMRNVELRK